MPGGSPVPKGVALGSRRQPQPIAHTERPFPATRWGSGAHRTPNPVTLVTSSHRAPAPERIRTPQASCAVAAGGAPPRLTHRAQPLSPAQDQGAAAAPPGPPPPHVVRAGAPRPAPRGRSRKCPSAPRMRPGGCGCQGDGRSPERLVLAPGELLDQVSFGGPGRLGSSSRSSQNVLLPEQESEFSPRGPSLPLGSGDPRATPAPCGGIWRPDASFAFSRLPPSCVVQPRTVPSPDRPRRSPQPSGDGPALPSLPPPALQVAACLSLSSSTYCVVQVT